MKKEPTKPKINDGGAVMPIFQEYVGPDEYTYHEPMGGLTKREYFAAKALFGAMVADIERAKRGLVIKNGEADLADTCFRIADAMLAESERGKSK